MQTKLTLLTALLMAAVLITGCCATSYTLKQPGGQEITVKNNRFFWATDSYSVNFSTNGASISVNKSSTDSAAIGAVAEGVAKGLASAVKP